MTDRRLAVIDLGSNSFRLVVFTWGEHGGHGWWRRTDEIHEAVRVGEGLDAAGELQPEPMERALETIELFAHFCRATGIDDVRPVADLGDPRRDQPARSSCRRRASARGSRSRCSRPRRRRATATSPRSTRRRSPTASRSTSAAARCSSRTSSGREARDMRSWPLGAVRMTERFLRRRQGQAQAAQGAARARAPTSSRSAGWLPDAGSDGARLAGIGGTVRNLAAAAELAAELPSFGVQGFLLDARGARRARRALRRHDARRSAARSPASSPSAAT